MINEFCSGFDSFYTRFRQASFSTFGSPKHSTCFVSFVHGLIKIMYPAAIVKWNKTLGEMVAANMNLTALLKHNGRLQLPVDFSLICLLLVVFLDFIRKYLHLLCRVVLEVGHVVLKWKLMGSVTIFNEFVATYAFCINFVVDILAGICSTIAVRVITSH